VETLDASNVTPVMWLFLIHLLIDRFRFFLSRTNELTLIIK